MDFVIKAIYEERNVTIGWKNPRENVSLAVKLDETKPHVRVDSHKAQKYDISAKEHTPIKSSDAHWRKFVRRRTRERERENNVCTP